MPEERVRFLIDENVDANLATELRKRDIDAINLQEINKRSIDDETLLEQAISERRAVVTHNIRHFAALHQRFLREDKTHYGIIVSKNTYIGTLINNILQLIDTEKNLKSKIVYL